MSEELEAVSEANITNTYNFKLSASVQTSAFNVYRTPFPDNKYMFAVVRVFTEGCITPTSRNNERSLYVL